MTRTAATSLRHSSRRPRAAHLHKRRGPHARSRVLHGLPAPVIFAVKRDLSVVTPIALTGFPMTAGQNNLNGIEASGGSRPAGRPASEGVLSPINRPPARTRRSISTGPSSPTATGCSSSGSARCSSCRTAEPDRRGEAGQRFRSGRVVRTITHPDFDVPTTVASSAEPVPPGCTLHHATDAGHRLLGHAGR